MQRNGYSVEFKLSSLKEFQEGRLTVRKFAMEKGIALSTFESWLTKARKYNGIPSTRKYSAGSLSLVEVTASVN